MAGIKWLEVASWPEDTKVVNLLSDIDFEVSNSKPSLSIDRNLAGESGMLNAQFLAGDVFGFIRIS